METLRIEDTLNMDGLHNLPFDSSFKPDINYIFNADSEILNIGFNDRYIDQGRFFDPSLSSYSNTESNLDTSHFLNNKIYDTNNTFSDLQNQQAYPGSEIPVTQLPDTCQLSSVAPALENSKQNTPSSNSQSSITGSSFKERPSREREYSICSDVNYASSRSSAESEDMSKTSSASPQKAIKPGKKRGRKKANISEEERRSRKLERGRVAANKCRQKKRVKENDLEFKALQLLAERDEMLKLNHDLRDEIKGLQAQVLRHMGGECGGIPDTEQVMSSVNVPSESLEEEVARRRGDQLKNLLGNQMYGTDENAFDAGTSQ